MSRHLAAKWLRRAEKLAGLPKLGGGQFHPYRRLWATERKHIPIQDVAEAGGWKSIDTVQQLYQQSDAAGIRRAIDG